MSFLILLPAHVYVSLFVFHCLCLLLSHSPPVLPTIHFHLINRHSYPLLSLHSCRPSPVSPSPSRPAESFKTWAISVLSLYSIPPSNTQNSLVCLSVWFLPRLPLPGQQPLLALQVLLLHPSSPCCFLQSRLVPRLSFIRRPITIAIVQVAEWVILFPPPLNY